MATAETTTMAAAADVPDAPAPAAPGDVELPPQTPPKTRRRRRAVAQDAPAPGPARTPEPAAPLSHEELAALGSLTVRARSNGQTLEEYVEDLRVELGAWDKLAALEAADA